jgi:hypothetical protein
MLLLKRFTALYALFGTLALVVLGQAEPEPYVPPPSFQHHFSFVAIHEIDFPLEPIPASDLPALLTPLFVGCPEQERVRIWMSPGIWRTDCHSVFGIRSRDSTLQWAKQWADQTQLLLWEGWTRLFPNASKQTVPAVAQTFYEDLVRAAYPEGKILSVGQQAGAFTSLSYCARWLNNSPHFSDALVDLMRTLQESKTETLTLFVLPSTSKEWSLIAILTAKDVR